MFCKKGGLMNFTNFTRKHLCWSFLNKAGLIARNFIKKDSNTGFFMWNLRNFQEHLFWRTSANGCFCLQFLCNMVSRYVWIHNFHYVHTCVITDATFSGMQLLISWWVNKLVYLLLWANACMSFTLNVLFVL